MNNTFVLEALEVLLHVLHQVPSWYAGLLLVTRANIDQVDATLFAEQRLNNVVIKVQQHLLNSQC